MTGGSGVGLWLSRLVVRAHGGELWLADSARGALFMSVWSMAPARRPVPTEQVPPFSSLIRRDGWPVDPMEFAAVVREARESIFLAPALFDFSELFPNSVSKKHFSTRV